MADADGTYTLLFSAGVYTTTGYSEGITTCSGPLGPCGVDTRILTSYGSVLGPGGGSLFADAQGAFWMDFAAWQGGSAGCTDYGCGATRQPLGPMCPQCQSLEWEAREATGRGWRYARTAPG